MGHGRLPRDAAAGRERRRPTGRAAARPTPRPRPIYRRLAAELVTALAERYARPSGRRALARQQRVRLPPALRLLRQRARRVPRLAASASTATSTQLNAALGHRLLVAALRRRSTRSCRRGRRPTATTRPALLDFQRFTSDTLLELLRDGARHHPRGRRDAADHDELHGRVPAARLLEVGSGGRRRSPTTTTPIPNDPESFRGAAFTRDLMRSLKPGRAVAADGAGDERASTGGRANAPKAPGQMAALAMQAVGRGADGIMFFQWRQSRRGSEKFHSAMLPQAGTRDAHLARGRRARAPTLGGAARDLRRRRLADARVAARARLGELVGDREPRPPRRARLPRARAALVRGAATGSTSQRRHRAARPATSRATRSSSLAAALPADRRRRGEPHRVRRAAADTCSSRRSATWSTRTTPSATAASSPSSARALGVRVEDFGALVAPRCTGVGAGGALRRASRPLPARSPARCSPRRSSRRMPRCSAASAADAPTDGRRSPCARSARVAAVGLLPGDGDGCRGRGHGARRGVRGSRRRAAAARPSRDRRGRAPRRRAHAHQPRWRGRPLRGHGCGPADGGIRRSGHARTVRVRAAAGDGSRRCRCRMRHPSAGSTERWPSSSSPPTPSRAHSVPRMPPRPSLTAGPPCVRPTSCGSCRWPTAARERSTPSSSPWPDPAACR